MAIICLSLLSLGCVLSGDKIAGNQLSFEDQQKAILEIAPLGTSREEAVRRLKTAGIECTPGVSQSTFYCDIWTRKDGTRWRMDVALLFDKSGKLYETRRAQSETGLAGNGAAVVGDTKKDAWTPAGIWSAANGDAETNEEQSSRASASRTPFAKRQ